MRADSGECIATLLDQRRGAPDLERWQIRAAARRDTVQEALGSVISAGNVAVVGSLPTAKETAVLNSLQAWLSGLEPGQNRDFRMERSKSAGDYVAYVGVVHKGVRREDDRFFMYGAATRPSIREALEAAITSAGIDAAGTNTQQPAIRRAGGD
jgi:hypothetical protein